MLSKLLLSALVAQSFVGLAAAAEKSEVRLHDADVEDLTLRDEPPMLGPHWSREHAGSRQARIRSANMTYHGGKIMATAVTKNIFWGPSWGTNPGDKITGLDQFYVGHNGSNYARTVDEYSGSNGQVGAATSHQGHVIDTSTASGGASTSAILAEVCKQVANGNIIPDSHGNGYYAVYTDVPRGNAGYCAYHSAGT